MRATGRDAVTTRNRKQEISGNNEESRRGGDKVVKGESVDV